MSGAPETGSRAPAEHDAGVEGPDNPTTRGGARHEADARTRNRPGDRADGHRCARGLTAARRRPGSAWGRYPVPAWTREPEPAWRRDPETTRRGDPESSRGRDSESAWAGDADTTRPGPRGAPRLRRDAPGERDRLRSPGAAWHGEGDHPDMGWLDASECFVMEVVGRDRGANNRSTFDLPGASAADADGAAWGVATLERARCLWRRLGSMMTPVRADQ